MALARGLGGITYRAYDVLLDQTVSITEFFPKFALRRPHDMQVTASQTSRPRLQMAKDSFLAEGRALEKLNHPALVNVQSIFEENGTYYLVTEYLDGDDIATELRRKDGFLTDEEVWEVAHQICGALDALHSAELLHLDVRPANLFRRQSGHFVLLTLGTTGKMRTEARTQDPASDCYYPIEQVMHSVLGTSLKPTVDIYSLAATLVEMLTGRPPDPARKRLSEAGVDLVRVLGGQASSPAVHLAELFPSLPRSWLNPLESALAYHPSSRTQTAGALLADLNRNRMGSSRNLKVPPIAETSGTWPELGVVVFGDARDKESSPAAQSTNQEPKRPSPTPLPSPKRITTPTSVSTLERAAPPSPTPLPSPKRNPSSGPAPGLADKITVKASSSPAPSLSSKPIPTPLPTPTPDPVLRHSSTPPPRRPERRSSSPADPKKGRKSSAPPKSTPAPAASPAGPRPTSTPPPPPSAEESIMSKPASTPPDESVHPPSKPVPLSENPEKCRITCRACGMGYVVSRTKVSGRSFKMRCKMCSEIFIVLGAVEEDEETFFTSTSEQLPSKPTDSGEKESANSKSSKPPAEPEAKPKTSAAPSSATKNHENPEPVDASSATNRDRTDRFLVVCSDCKKRHYVSRKRVTNRVFQFACKKCGEVQVVKGPLED